MKFKKEIEIEIGEWSDDSLYAWEGPWNHYIKHERDLPKDWPQNAIDHATQVIHENRELEKGETQLRGVGGIVRMLRVDGAGLIVTSAGVHLLHRNLPERLAFIEANKPKEWSVEEWDHACGLIRVFCPTGTFSSIDHERYIGDWPKETQDLARKRIIANRPIEAHEFRPVSAPETIDVFEIRGLVVHSGEHCLGFEAVRAGNHDCSPPCLEKYRPNALRMIAWCREQPEYKAWLKEHQRTHSELGEDGVLRFVDTDGDETEVRAVSGERFEWRWSDGTWGKWSLADLSDIDDCHHSHEKAIRKLCADWEKANAIEDVTVEYDWSSPRCTRAVITPEQFKGRKFTVTFSDAGPIGGGS